MRLREFCRPSGAFSVLACNRGLKPPAIFWQSLRDSGMARNFRDYVMRFFCATAVFLGLASFVARGEDAWTVKDAPWRVAVTARETTAHPEAGYSIVLPEFGQTRPDMSDVVLTNTAGQALPLVTLYRHEGASVLLLAQQLETGKPYYVYFGGGVIRRGPGWTPKISLVMETRRAPAGMGFDDWASVEKAWREGNSDGAGFVPLIYHGENLYGESTDFLTHYTGWLQTSGTETVRLYTLSSDASFVVVNDVYAFGWPGKHSPDANEGTVANKAVPGTPGFTKIDYYAAKGGDAQPPPAMVLGWQRGGKFETIPSEAWLHPSAAQLSGIEGVHDIPAPVADVHFRSYMGFDGLWFYETSCSLPGRNLGGWSVQWYFSDGTVVSGSDCTRLLAGNAPQTVTVQLQRGGESISGIRRIVFNGNMPEASIKDAGELAHYLDLFDKENPAQMSAGTLAAEFRFLRVFGSDQQCGRVANALLQQQKPAVSDPLWIDVKLAHLRLLAQSDPRGALVELHQIDGGIWKKYERTLDLFELDLLAFGLRDGGLVNRASQIAFLNPNTDLPAIAKVRVGDLYRSLGKYREAIAQFQQLGAKGDARSIPAQDRAYSITVNELLAKSDREEAAGKLLEWEMRHPMAEFGSDYLLLRARTLMAFGRWSEALAEIESFEKVQPESSFEIEAEFYRARALYEVGRKDEARKTWSSIAQNYPKHELAEQSKRWAAKP